MSMSSRSLLRLETLLVAACLLAPPAWAQNVNIGTPWVRGTVVGQGATGAFMELTATENSALVGVSSPVAGVAEVHEMTMDNGIMKMRAMTRLDLPAGKAVALKPGSYHIMLMELKQPLKKGDAVPLTLRIETKDKKIVTLETRAEVRDAAGAGSATATDEHQQHKHHMH